MDFILNQIFQLILENLYTIITIFFTVLLFPLLVSYIQKEYWSSLAKKKNIWKRFIVKDSYIKKCVDTYQEAEKTSEISYIVVFTIPLLLSIYLLSQLIIYVLLMIIVERKIIPIINYYAGVGGQSGDDIIFIASLFVIFVFTTPLIIYSSWMKTTLNELNLKNYKNAYSDVKTLFFICFLLSVIYSLFVITFITNGKEETYAFVLLLIIPLFMIVNVISYKKSATIEIKNIVNSMYSSRFPCVQISTMGAERYVGRLINIFDDDSIRLMHRKNEIIILWDAVATITELNEIEGKQKQLSSFKERS